MPKQQPTACACFENWFRYLEKNDEWHEYSIFGQQKRFLLNWYIFIAYFFEVVPFLKVIDLWEWLLTVSEQNGSERKSWQYLNFYANTEGSVFYWICFILFTKYKNGRFTVVWTMFINIRGKFMYIKQIRQW